MNLRRSVWYATIENGKLTLDQIDLFRVYLKSVKGSKRLEVVLQEISRDKTNEQLGYFFGVLVPAFMELTGYSKNESDGVLSRFFLTRNRGQSNEFVESKANLTTVGMCEFIDHVLMLLAENGVTVEPRPLISDKEP